MTVKASLSMPLISIDEDAERLVSSELLDYCESLAGTNFNHAFMGAGEALTEFLVEFDLATDTSVGFSDLLTGEERETYLWATDLRCLPCLEDLIEVSLGMAVQYDLSPDHADDWKVPAKLSGNLIAPLRRAGLVDGQGIWTERSIPIQLRAEFLRVDGDEGCPEASELVESYADSSILGMPKKVSEALIRLDPFSLSYERFECERLFGNEWRFGSWLTDEQRRRCAPLGSEFLVHHVVDQILINRHNGKPGYSVINR